MTPITKQHIESSAEVFGGKPCIAGTRIRVVDIVAWHERQGIAPDEIVSAYPSLTLGDVHAALAYYWDHREDLETQMRKDEAASSRLKASYPSKLLSRLAGMDADDDHPVSS